jgi:hypothetical protein
LGLFNYRGLGIDFTEAINGCLQFVFDYQMLLTVSPLSLEVMLVGVVEFALVEATATELLVTISAVIAGVRHYFVSLQ